jgi:hypothetical protein
MDRRLAKGAIIVGLAVLLSDAVLAYLKHETELKFVDVTSGNPRWVRPVPTRFDEFVLLFPLGKLLILGIVLLAFGCAGTFYRKWNRPDSNQDRGNSDRSQIM